MYIKNKIIIYIFFILYIITKHIFIFIFFILKE
jgi:hypothetical protein